MPHYTVEVTYHLPVYRQRSYSAETPAQACRLAIEDDGWRTPKRMRTAPVKATSPEFGRAQMRPIRASRFRPIAFRGNGTAEGRAFRRSARRPGHPSGRHPSRTGYDRGRKGKGGLGRRNGRGDP